jgi:hypothetical protein
MRWRGIATLAGVCLMTLSAVFAGQAGEGPDVVVFYREASSEWLQMDRVLQDLQEQYPALKVYYVEHGESDAELLWDLARHYGIFPAKYPVVFVGQDAIVGVGQDKEERLRSAVAGCMGSGCPSPLSYVGGPNIPWRAYLFIGLAALMLLLIYLE